MYGCSVDAEAIYRPTTGWYMSGTVFVESYDIRSMKYHISWQAYGIHSGGNFVPRCDNSPDLDYGIFGNIVFAKDALGVEILRGP